MEPGTTTSPSTGSTTMATLIPAAAEQYGDAVAQRFKHGGEWQTRSYRELARDVEEIGLGLLDLGVELADRVAILATTRPEWTLVDFGAVSAGATVVPIYPTNSPSECAWVAGDSGARVVVCENAEQVDKIVAVRDQLPALEQIVVIDPDGADAAALPLADLRARGRARDVGELAHRREQVTRDHAFTFIYTSGTTGPPKGCVLSHGNYRDTLEMCYRTDLVEPDDVAYLYLPLAHSFALLIQLLTLDIGSELAYFGGDRLQILAELSEVEPTFLPSVPRIFEKIYTVVTGQAEPGQIEQATKVGVQVRDLQLAGKEVPAELQSAFDQLDERLFKNVRAAFGGRVRMAGTGAAPIAKEILEFFYAAGVPVLEGYGMTETSTIATFSTIAEHRFGTVGRPLPGVEARIAEDGELLIKGPNVFQGYHNNADASFGAIVDGWLHTGDLAAIDDEGYVTIVGRKKDIIITAGGKNLAPALIENELRQSRWISEVVMHGDRRPYPVALVTLDPEEIVPWAQNQAHPPIEDTSIAALARHPDVIALIEGVFAEVNPDYAAPNQIKRFFILEHELAQETGELTPTLKVKRNVVNEKYADRFDALYAED